MNKKMVTELNRVVDMTKSLASFVSAFNWIAIW